MNRKIVHSAWCTISALGLLAAVGCSSNKPSSGPSGPTVTDIAPLPPTPAPSVAPAPQPYVQPTDSLAMTAPAPAQTSNTYVVQKGDTLYKIARQHYGDPSAWKKIAAANPGSENIIKPGQKLVLP